MKMTTFALLVGQLMILLPTLTSSFTTQPNYVSTSPPFFATNQFPEPFTLQQKTRNNLHVMKASSSTVSEGGSPRQLLSRGMQKFKEGDIQGSIDLFDAVDRSAPGGSLRPYLWQRGISYYYADRFQEGSDQVSNMNIILSITVFAKLTALPHPLLYVSKSFIFFSFAWM